MRAAPHPSSGCSLAQSAGYLPCLPCLRVVVLNRPSCISFVCAASSPVPRSHPPHFISIAAGNHDGEADLSRREVVALDAATGDRLSLTKSGPARLSGAGNYWLDVLAPGNSSKVAARLWFLDSGNRGCDGGAAGW